MALDRNRVTTVTFDSYSTLVDVSPETLAPALEDITDDPLDVARLWRRRSLEYARISNDVGGYRTFYGMNRAALSYALDVHSIETDRETREEILSTYHDPDVFDDVRGVFEQLADAGYEPWILSNGDPEMLESLVETACVDDLVRGTVSADEICTYKPAVDLYRHAAGRTGTLIEEICHVTAGWVDVMGATNAGIQAVWLNRTGDPWEAFGEDPALIVDGLDTFVDEFLG